MAGSQNVKKLPKGEVLFHEGDAAKVLYIIQKGQLRLYRPKGKGHVEIAVLRTGEVIGEMAYFDKNPTKRSCSASAMIDTEIIEIPFEVFNKMMASINPWIKTILYTLVDRLKTANGRIKALDSSSAKIDYSTGKQVGAEFIKPTQAAQIISTIYLSIKSHGKDVDGKLALSKKTLQLYACDIFNLHEAKMEHVLLLFEELSLLEIIRDREDDLIVLNDADAVKTLLVFYNAERHLPDDKKMKVSKRCFAILEKVLEKIKEKKLTDKTVHIELNEIFTFFLNQGKKMTIVDLEDANDNDFTQSVIIDGDVMTLPVNRQRLEKYLPLLKFMHLLEQRNEQ
ncbi:MAG: cyclic nucleotide-binding domain-containing protein [Bacteriovoracaceae bacterium]|jgi:CRP-like cAMP-binding protein|nr:cyclic nucleotide-binding domain-containing protein [Bacteriovoracaceae bacterium]